MAKWKKNYRGKKTKEPWFLLTNLSGFSLAIKSYKKRMGIEEMFRDFKKGGYNLEANYLGRPTEAKRQTRRHSRFYLGLHGRDWLDSLDIFAKEVEELLSLSPQKCLDYQRGRRAAKLILQAF